MLNQFPFPLLTLNQAGLIIEVNSAMKHLTDYDNEELLQKTFISLLQDYDASEVKEQINKVENGTIGSFDTGILGKNGVPLRLQFVLLPLIQGDQIKAIHVITRDITESEQTKDALLQAQDQISNIFDTLDVSIWSVNVQDNKILHLSPGTEIIYKRTLQEFHDNPMLWKMVIHEKDLPIIEQMQQQLRLGLSMKNEYRIIHPDGNIRWIHTRTIPQLDRTGALITLTGIVLDITERKELEEKIRSLAFEDPLTGLPNRKQFEDILEIEIQKSKLIGRKMALCTLHVSRYKKINDTLGDHIADQSIRLLAERLTECIPDRSCIARIREDDFAILIKDVERTDEVLAFADQLIQKASRLFHVKNFEFHMFSNIGISLFPHDCNDHLTMIKQSAIALHRAKQHGLNNIEMYNSELDIESYQNYTMERDLYKAIERDELTLFYQPKIDAQSYKIVGIEALLRWNHPEWGLVLPAKFIPIAEETDLIVYLGDWVLKQACLQNKAWQQAGFSPVRVSVNFSAKQFIRKDMLAILEQILTETEIDPKWLEIEITENTLLQLGEMDSLSAIRSMGITLCIDDFGTGYSSLNYIRQLKADVLKLDKSFIQNICENNEDKAIVKVMIGMAHDLNIAIIAEGVETKDQLSLLRKLKCHEIQGFLFSPPVAPEDCEKLLAKEYCILTDESVTVKENIQNRRKFFRIEFPYPLRAEMTLEEINGKKVSIGSTEILIDDMGPGGLRFLSFIEFPQRPNVIYKIRTELLGNIWEFSGEVVWEIELIPGIHQFGVKFRIDESMQMSLIQMLNQLSVKLRRDPIVPDSGFMMVDKKKYLLSHQYKNKLNA
ncbi:EAL domain-containing protein [Paenibacillus alginolyticus]|uniref:EAL domain-containing protein n=1 Tax=Paenibacillus alginolyticus TaxID=59839 RepID=UPI00227EBD94|nr:EAL domain-containing protein [Paenibacillus alginolyticus]MEC0144862.1 EAL domain-containing protein [Paenibacillus alginolyticus]